MTKIQSISAREILDSRGYPTIETVVRLENGVFAVSSVPSGASTGSHEAVELRDNDAKRFLGKGVLTAVNNVKTTIAQLLVGRDVEDQETIDRDMIMADGTENKAKLGANAILSVSMACLKASAKTANKPLYQYIKDYYHVVDTFTLPRPTFNVINGGKHGNGKLEFQEFHILPRKNQSFAEMMRMGDEVYLYLLKLLKDKGIFQGIGDEGGFTGNFANNKQALEVMVEAIKKAGYLPKEDLGLGLDVAASEFYAEGKYHITDLPYPLSPEEQVAYLVKLDEEYHFDYLEDGLFEDDWDNWAKLTQIFAAKNIPVIGDDFLTTNPTRVGKAIAGNFCNAVLVKPNQIGSITEVIDVVRKAKAANWTIVLSHRSGETNDDFISDFAVGVGADIVKFGSPARGERVAKYNRLMEIETELLG